jgi:hypothetical protein
VAGAVADLIIELVYHDVHVVVPGQVGFANRGDQTEAAAPQRRVEDDAIGASQLVVAASEHRGLIESNGQLSDRILARRITATRQLDPARAIYPLCRAGISPQRTSEDLPQPEVPMTGRNRDDPSRRSRSSVSFSRPKKR